MYNMYLNDIQTGESKGSLELYRQVFRSLNLSFIRPKKDQCSLCMSYREGTVEAKQILEETFTIHNHRKVTTRGIKDRAKQRIMCDPSHACAVFDIQFTTLVQRLVFATLGMKLQAEGDHQKFVTCVYMFLRKLDEMDTKTVALFADSCGGQNKNTIVAALLLYVVHHSSYLDEITLNFFGPNYCQSEGDSAHSAIACAIKQAGDILYHLSLSQYFVWLRERNHMLCMICNLPTSLTSSNSQNTCACILLNLPIEPIKQLSGRKLQN
ncbi:hypothetical protein PR048_032710 [Dryococelus australis]|uniref:Uncharacterized protein n=1 Tax=Dryococelus australis TaxID=614101 RepID=A0ABQ9G730_9NEOP|nr:hypothetical protein PR048_032710 [Dryococelus australis]